MNALNALVNVAVKLRSVDSKAVTNQILLLVTRVSVTLEQKIKGATRGKIIMALKMVAGALMDDVISNALPLLLVWVILLKLLIQLVRLI